VPAYAPHRRWAECLTAAWSQGTEIDSIIHPVTVTPQCPPAARNPPSSFFVASFMAAVSAGMSYIGIGLLCARSLHRWNRCMPACSQALRRPTLDCLRQ
jgi:hypothetical protein